MGDRVAIVFKGAGNNISPGVYMHWSGYEAWKYLRAAAPRLRDGDTGYSAARLCGECHVALSGNTGLGLLPEPPADSVPLIGQDTDEARKAWGMSGYGHGDNGVIIVDFDQRCIWHAGGYSGPGEGERDDAFWHRYTFAEVFGVDALRD